MDGQSHLLLIRDEGGPPEAQVGTAENSNKKKRIKIKIKKRDEQHTVAWNKHICKISHFCEVDLKKSVYFGGA